MGVGRNSQLGGTEGGTRKRGSERWRKRRENEKEREREGERKRWRDGESESEREREKYCGVKRGRHGVEPKKPGRKVSSERRGLLLEATLREEKKMEERGAAFN
ncbi:RNA-binding protein 25-like [Belonocnema kinseyi]|uniref:RNA-binding protein 25-like n=1 Tax=Belonocnema kinseyi TaxID=2817044 RepID=UPI00143D4ED5|nr:RNA-binding protein 25-like [Belonocnema kinseyi]